MIKHTLQDVDFQNKFTCVKGYVTFHFINNGVESSSLQV